MGKRDGVAVSSAFTGPVALDRRTVLRSFSAIGPVLIPMLLLILLAWALRLYRLDAQSFWYDEGYAVYVAGLGPAETLYWSSRDVVPPLHSYLLALWLLLGGGSEFSARFLSTWMGTFAVAVFARMGKDLHSHRAGLLAGFLVAISPFYVWYGQDTRMYMSQALFGLLATLLLMRALKRPERWWLWAGLAFLDTLTLYTQVTGGVLIVFHALVILASGLSEAERARLVRGMLALAGVLLLWLPWVIYALPFLGENAGYWPGRLGWQFVVSDAFEGFVTGQVMDGALERVSLAVWGVACLAGVFALLISPAGRGRRTAIFLLAHFAVPVALMAWLLQNIPKFSPRYLIVASPPVFLLPAMGLATLLQHWPEEPALGQRARWVMGGLALTALATTAVLGLSNLYFDPASAKSDFRAAARLVREQIAPDEVVLLVPGHTFPVWQFYFGSEGWLALPDDPILNVNHVLHYCNTVGRLNEWLDGRSGVWLVEWEPQVVDPTGLVPSLLEQVGDEVPLALAEEPAGLRLRHYRLRAGRLPLPPEPAVSPPLDSLLDLPLNLVGCALPQWVRGDQEVRVACCWEARNTLPHHLFVSARLLDAAGTEWGRADAAISGPYLMAGRWPLGELVLGQYTLHPFPGIPPGDFYRLQLLVYELDGTMRGTAIAGSLAIDRPASPFSGTLPSSQVPPSRLGGLVMEAANVRPEQVLPGEEVRVEAIWRVAGPFQEPRLVVEGAADEWPLLSQPGATGAWEVGDRYLTISRVQVSPFALGGLTNLLAVSGERMIPVGTVHVDVTRTFTLPVGVQPVDYRLGDAIALVGAQLAVEPGDTGRTATVVLYWRAGTFVDHLYTVFVHLVGPDGQIHAQADAPPQAGRHPTTCWLPGEVVADSHQLELPAGVLPGVYRVLVGLYDPTTLARLPVTDADGDLSPDDAILIGSFEVLP